MVKRYRSGQSKRKQGRKALRRSRYSRMKNSVVREGGRLTSITTMNKTVYYNKGIVTGLLTDTAGANTFKLNQIGDYTSLTNVFDQYKVNYVTYTFIPRQNVIGATTSSSYSDCSIFASCVDFDDSSATTMANIMDYDNVKITRGMAVHKRSFKPKAAMLYTNPQTAPAQVGIVPFSGNPWIDCSYTDAPHYGIKWVVGDSDGQVLSYDIIVKANISFRNIR